MEEVCRIEIKTTSAPKAAHNTNNLYWGLVILAPTRWAGEKRGSLAWAAQIAAQSGAITPAVLSRFLEEEARLASASQTDQTSK
jgi:hypothetical protein